MNGNGTFARHEKTEAVGDPGNGDAGSGELGELTGDGDGIWTGPSGNGELRVGISGGPAGAAAAGDRESHYS